MTAAQNQPTVLVVDDEPAYVDAYTTWLEASYTVKPATSAHEALNILDESVDIALLDRRMPDKSGDELLQEIRARGLDCRVAMVTAVEPKLDIIELPFDEYLVKPVSKADLRTTVESLMTRASLSEAVQECYAMASKKVALENAMRQDELESSHEYRKLTSRLSSAEKHIDDMIERLIEDERLVTAYKDIG